MEKEPLKIPEQEARKLMAAGNGDAALLYLYITAELPRAEAMEKLRMTQTRYDLAVATLQQLGLWKETEKRFLTPAEAPRYTEEDLKREYHARPEFPSMIGEAQRRLGRILSTEELKILLCIYRYLGLPAEVISILIHYCIEKGRARGSGRLPSLRMIEKEAYHWADLGIDTMEEAAVYMQNQLQLQSRVGAIRQVLQLSDRRLTPGEEKLVRTWLDWGFGEDEIRLAYEKTCMNTGALKWPYLNSILKSWHDQGLTTLRQIETGDRAPQSARTRKPPIPQQAVIQHGDEPGEFERRAMEQMMQKGLYKEDE